MIEFLYEQALLFKQQQTEELNKQAADNFEVPELDVSGEPIGKYTLEELIGQMSELSRVLDEEIDKTDELCVEELRDIDERIGNLIDLKYGKGGYNESIVEAVKGLEELEKVVDKSTEML